MSVTNILRPLEWETTVDGYPNRAYYLDAFRSSIESFWRQTDFATDTDYRSLAYFRAIRSFVAGDEEAIADRRRLLFHFMRGLFSTENPDDILQRAAHRLPIDSVLPKVLRNICLAYKQAPERVFRSGDTDYSEAFRRVYKQLRFDQVARRAYRLAKAHNVCAVRPWIHDETNRIRADIITPDMYRTTLERGEITELYYQIDLGGKNALRVWSKDETKILDASGKVVKGSEAENRYGRIPFSFLQMEQQSTDEPYGGGLFSLVEENLKANQADFEADLSRTFGAIGVWIKVNTNEENLQITPDKVITADEVRDGEGQYLPPHVEHVVGNGMFREVRDDKTRNLTEALRGLGLPSSMIEEGTGAPVSGFAMLLDRIELLEQRDDDKGSLITWEMDFADNVAKVAEIDGWDEDDLPLSGEFEVSIDFAEEKIWRDPNEEIADVRDRVERGEISIAEYARRAMGIDDPDEESVVAMIKKRRETWAELGNPVVGEPTEGPREEAESTGPTSTII